jgi:hypothetical protein
MQKEVGEKDMIEIEKNCYSLHPQFNPAHRSVKVYNWIVNQIKEESHPVCFDVIFSKIQHDFENSINQEKPPSKEQTVEGIKNLLSENLIIVDTN